MIFNFTGVMIAEMYASRTGIGHLIASWGENFQMPQLFAGVILLADGGDRLQRDRALAGGSMQHVADVKRAARADARRRHRGRGAVATSTRGARARCRRWRTSRSPSAPGRFVVIVGPSGCGKTSLLMMMAGLRHQTSRHHPVRRPADRRARSRPRRRGVPGGEPVSLAHRARQHRVSARASAARRARSARQRADAMLQSGRPAGLRQRAIRTSCPAA